MTQPEHPHGASVTSRDGSHLVEVTPIAAPSGGEPQWYARCCCDWSRTELFQNVAIFASRAHVQAAR